MSGGFIVDSRALRASRHDQTEPSNAISDDIKPAVAPIRAALTPRQETRLIDYLDAEFLQLNRKLKKRQLPDAPLAQLMNLISAFERLFDFILGIPALGRSGQLRSAYLLRLLGDLTDALTSHPGVLEAEPERERDTLFDFLDELDFAWSDAIMPGAPWAVAKGTSSDRTRRPGQAVEVDDRGPGLTVTDRVRLLNLVISLREMLIASFAPLQNHVDKASAAGPIEVDEDSDSDLELISGPPVKAREQTARLDEVQDVKFDVQDRREAKQKEHERASRVFERTLAMLADLKD
ncbi:uncharacterized protein L969DRAFT_91026 [Mixia osmundae IAM 14324]|uniref:Uncharacterized protein n=1 Tax=Mixia osmundae (strain CBS 9802 / IAM 14324 / JCM 22182 / KY 12970) TaxID=764103 RepID=G7DUM7_MIXOS|nr:uncharacterized protein L969DRAFT_91026 [Mixia osmundae IAM 14324]KEI36379.1 hypothetical protein L969DRAFT_91026 [Mixia osmundae IAM 14324]GAA94287.1 hypothetical protein E5Q_00936 [Mixia osmundae IAM 14324]